MNLFCSRECLDAYNSASTTPATPAANNQQPAAPPATPTTVAHGENKEGEEADDLPELELVEITAEDKAKAELAQKEEEAALMLRTTGKQLLHLGCSCADGDCRVAKQRRKYARRISDEDKEMEDQPGVKLSYDHLDA